MGTYFVIVVDQTPVGKCRPRHGVRALKTGKDLPTSRVTYLPDRGWAERRGWEERKRSHNGFLGTSKASMIVEGNQNDEAQWELTVRSVSSTEDDMMSAVAC